MLKELKHTKVRDFYFFPIVYTQSHTQMQSRFSLLIAVQTHNVKGHFSGLLKPHTQGIRRIRGLLVTLPNI